MLQGGHSPELGIEWYEQTFASIKAGYPSLVLHSLGGSEVMHISRTSALPVDEVVRRLRDAGLDALQISLQDVDRARADAIAGFPAHETKLEAARPPIDVSAEAPHLDDAPVDGVLGDRDIHLVVVQARET